MGLLDRLLRRSRAAEAVVEHAPCPHVVTTARWDSVADMGDDSKAIGFICTACRQEFTAEEGVQLRADEAERVRRRLTGSEPPS